MRYNEFMTENKEINIVKRRLWASGYAVSERSRGTDGFDLIVDGRHKLIVCRKGEERRLKELNPIATIACVHYAFSKPFVGYVWNGGYSSSPRIVFGLPASKSKDKNGNKKTRKGKEGDEGRPQKFAVGGHI